MCAWLWNMDTFARDLHVHVCIQRMGDPGISSTPLLKWKSLCMSLLETWDNVQQWDVLISGGVQELGVCNRQMCPVCQGVLFAECLSSKGCGVRVHFARGWAFRRQNHNCSSRELSPVFSVQLPAIAHSSLADSRRVAPWAIHASLQHNRVLHLTLFT